jgi:UDP-N-acetylglucosamine/UDP-N-acetylgalactosamine diphosphorylase
VEYSEITKEMAYEKDDKGYLVYDTSHMLNAVYNLDFLEFIVKEGAAQLVKEYHLAKKKIKFYHSESKEIITPADINGYKFELFIFDAFLLVQPQKFGLVEVHREREFAPVKNAPGAAEDSPDTARELLSKLHQGWFEKQGVKFEKQAGKEADSLFEIDASKVYDDEDLKLGVLADRYKDEPVKLPHFVN